MAFDITNTHHLLAAYEQTTPASSFLRDRYFPCNPSTDIFTTDDVLMEFKKGTQKLAPFVSPRVGGKTVLRQGYKMERYEPAFVAPKRPLTADDLNKKGFGESIYAQLTPDQRQGAIVARDMVEMEELIVRREEAMAAEVMTTNGLIMKHYGDNDTDYEEKAINFYEGESNPAVFTVTTPWTEEGADLYRDIRGMLEVARDNTIRATELLVTPDVAFAIMENAALQNYLNIEGYKLGHIEPRELNAVGAAYIGTLNILGKMIDVISYDAQYEDDNGTMVPYLPAGTAILTAPAAGRSIYGAITQMESDKNFHTHAGKRVPKFIAHEDKDVRELRLASRPLLMPNQKNGFIVSHVG